MRIESSSFGNYNPMQVRSNAKVAQTQNLQKTEKKEAVKNEPITNDEKLFFAKMYPDEKNTIVNYHYYEKNGEMQGVAKGSLFDRRG